MAVPAPLAKGGCGAPETHDDDKNSKLTVGKIKNVMTWLNLLCN